MSSADAVPRDWVGADGLGRLRYELLVIWEVLDADEAGEAASRLSELAAEQTKARDLVSGTYPYTDRAGPVPAVSGDHHSHYDQRGLQPISAFESRPEKATRRGVVLGIRLDNPPANDPVFERMAEKGPVQLGGQVLETDNAGDDRLDISAVLGGLRRLSKRHHYPEYD